MSLKVGEINPQHHYKLINTLDPYGTTVETEYNVTFRITEACDLQCNYCHWYGGPQYKFEDITQTIDVLYKFFQKKRFKAVSFYFHGGEPTRHRKVIDILQYFRRKEEQTNITTVLEMQTNLTSPRDLIDSMLPLIDRLDVSFHYLELSNRGKKLQQFVDNFNYLISLDYTIHTLDIMMENIPPLQLQSFYNIVLDMLEYKNITYSEMIYGFCHYEYNDETREQHLAFYSKHNKTEQQYDIDGTIYNTNELFMKGIDCRGWKCEAGIESVTINGNGDVFHCGIHMTNYLRECIPDEKPYANCINDVTIQTKLNVLFMTGTMCRWDYCGGDFYLQRTKS